VDAEQEFVFEECEIPGGHPWCYEIDDKGVYQVYKDGQGSFLLSFLYLWGDAVSNRSIVN
jgi:hypothetical protein